MPVFFVTWLDTFQTPCHHIYEIIFMCMCILLLLFSGKPWLMHPGCRWLPRVALEKGQLQCAENSLTIAASLPALSLPPIPTVTYLHHCGHDGKLASSRLGNLGSTVSCCNLTGDENPCNSFSVEKLLKRYIAHFGFHWPHRELNTLDTHLPKTYRKYNFVNVLHCN